MKVNKHTVKLAGVLALGFTLSACFDNSDNDEKPMVNNPPQANSFDVITQTEVAITEQLSGSDIDGDPITFILDQEPLLGNVSVTNTGSFTYQPFDEVTGIDSFSYIVRDSAGAESKATVGITIEALQVSFLSYSRQAFNANATDKPLVVNGREFIQDVASQTDFQDLIDNDSQ
jgi:hypothetical protein